MRPRSNCPRTCRRGYHRLHAQAGGQLDISTTLIVSPGTLGRAGHPTMGPGHASSTASPPRIHGASGDLTDLTDLAVWSAARHGAGFILVNAAARGGPGGADGTLALPARLPPGSSIRSICGSRPSPNTLCCANAARCARRAPTWPHRRPSARTHRPRRRLEGQAVPPSSSCYRVPRSAGRELAYAACAGTAKDAASTTSPPGARWPRCTAPTGTAGRTPLTHPDGPAVAEFAAQPGEAVDFHRWLQWLLDDQLTAAQATAGAGRDVAGHHARPGGRGGP